MVSGCLHGALRHSQYLLRHVLFGYATDSICDQESHMNLLSFMCVENVTAKVGKIGLISLQDLLDILMQALLVLGYLIHLSDLQSANSV